MEVRVGQVVRVRLADGQARRGVVTEAGEGAAHVLLEAPPPCLREAQSRRDHGATLEEEELRVPLADVSSLGASDEAGQAEPRARAAELARLKDFASARAVLVEALVELAPRASVGATVVVHSGHYDERGLLGEAEIGMVDFEEEEEDALEVMLDGGAERKVPRKDAVAVPSGGGPALRFGVLLCDAAKYAMQQEPHDVASALEATDVCLAICKCLRTADQEQLSTDVMAEGWEALVDEAEFQASMLKARAHILHGKYQAAARDVKRAVLLKPSDERARQLVSVTKQRSAHAAAQDRALAKNVTRWVDKVMREQQQQQQQEPGQGEQRAEGGADASEGDEGGLVGWFRRSFT